MGILYSSSAHFFSPLYLYDVIFPLYIKLGLSKYKDDTEMNNINVQFSFGEFYSMKICVNMILFRHIIF